MCRVVFTSAAFAACAVPIAALALAACAAGTLDAPERFAPHPADGGDATGAPLADAATPACADVPSALFAPVCGPGCHAGATPQAGLDLASPGVVARLLGKSAVGGAGLLLDPKTPEASLVYTKLTATPPFGTRMPAPPTPPLDDATIACVLGWVKQNAAPPVGADAGVDAAPDRGQELLWIDQDLVIQASPYPPTPDKAPPSDWYAPVDYYDGAIEVRLDVTEKADSTPVWLELCMWQGASGSSNFTCVHCIDPPFTATGSYTCETTPSAGFNAASVDFHQPFAAMQHRAKDTTHNGPDLANEGKGLPIQAHYTAVLVPKGATFSGWAAYGR